RLWVTVPGRPAGFRLRPHFRPPSWAAAPCARGPAAAPLLWVRGRRPRSQQGARGEKFRGGGRWPANRVGERGEWQAAADSPPGQLEQLAGGVRRAIQRRYGGLETQRLRL